MNIILEAVLVRCKSTVTTRLVILRLHVCSENIDSHQTTDSTNYSKRYIQTITRLPEGQCIQKVNFARNQLRQHFRQYCLIADSRRTVLTNYNPCT